MTMKAHTYYINLGRPPIGGKLPLIPPPGGATDGYHRRLVHCTTETVADVAGRRQLRSASRGLLNFPRYNMPNYGQRAFCFAGPYV